MSGPTAISTFTLASWAAAASFWNVGDWAMVSGEWLHTVTNMEVSINGDTPIAGWFIREHLMKRDDDWGYPYFRTPPYMVKPPMISIGIHHCLCITLHDRWLYIVSNSAIVLVPTVRGPVYSSDGYYILWYTWNYRVLCIYIYKSIPVSFWLFNLAMETMTATHGESCFALVTEL